MAKYHVRRSVLDDGIAWKVPRVGELNLGSHSTATLRAHWIEHGQPILELRAFVRLSQGMKTLMDVGAAEGLFSLAFCRITSGRAFAFEPSPVMLGRLQDNLRRNPALNVSVVEAAMGPANSLITFREEIDGMWMPTAQRTAGEQHMSTVTLDEWCAANDVYPDILKIDIEGLELGVLNGAANVLAASRPVVLLELHPERITLLGFSLESLGVLLSRFRYKAETLRGRTVEDLLDFVASSKEDTSSLNVVLMPLP